jgi:hypothetical protein
MSSAASSLLSVMIDVPSSTVVASIMTVLFPDAQNVLDLTYGSGKFWAPPPRPWAVYGMDIDSERHPDVVGDFRNVQCRDALFDVVVFDPPYISNPGKGIPGVMASRFGGYENVLEMEKAIKAGTFEAWRVCRLGIIVKIQNHIHGAKLIHMTKWVESTVPMPLYDEIHAVSSQLVHMKKRDVQYSATRNHATYLVFRKGSQYHRGRKNASSVR